jgi:hypothetical protein
MNGLSNPFLLAGMGNVTNEIAGEHKEVAVTRILSHGLWEHFWMTSGFEAHEDSQTTGRADLGQ